MVLTRKEFNERQRQWAVGQGLQVTKDYLASYDKNLFEPLSSRAFDDYSAGNGGELKDNMRSLLRSSSALAANTFHYWSRQHWLMRAPLHEALGATCADGEIRYEYKPKDYPLKIFLPNTPSPNIDVVFRYGNGGDTGEASALGIESKLQELFDHKTMEFGVTYTKKRWWMDCGLSNCQALVDKIMAKQEKFEHLGADQLLKHALGLATEFKGRFALLYLYYEFADAPAAQDHRDDIKRFEKAIDGEFDFRVMTYQTLYANLLDECKNSMGWHKTYLDNLALRYF